MKKFNVTRNTLRGTFWGVSNKIAEVLFPFLIRTILIYKMGSEYAGLSSLFTSILQVISLADLGFSSAMVFSMYEPIAREDKIMLSALLNYFRKIYFIIGCIVLVFGISVMPFLKYLIKGDVPPDINIYSLFLIYLINTAISYLLFAYRGSLLSAYQREDENAVFRLLTNIMMYLCQIVVLLKFSDYYAYIIFLPIFTFIYNFSRYCYVKKQYPDIVCQGEISNTQKQSIRKNVTALFLHKVGSVTVNTLDNIVISMILGLVVLSNYNNYYYIINAVTSIIIIFFNAITAGIGNRLVISTQESNRRSFYAVFYVNAAVVAIATICIFAMIQDFIVLWIGKAFLFDTVTVIMLCVYFYIHTIRRTIITFRDASGMWVDNRWQPLVSSTVNLLLNLALVRIIGIKGVLFATIFSMLMVDIPWETGRLIKKLFQESCHHYFLMMMYYTAITILGCLACVLFKQILPNGSLIIRLGCEFIFSLIVGIGLFVLFTGKSQEYRILLKKIKQIIKR